MGHALKDHKEPRLLSRLLLSGYSNRPAGLFV